MLAAIGEVAAESAAVDEKLRDVFGLLMESPYARIIAAGEDTGRLVQMCLRVAAYNTSLTDESLEQLQRLCSAMDMLRPPRNLLIHSTWQRIDGPGVHVSIRSRRPSASGETSEGYRWTPQEALQIAENYRVAAARLDEFIEDSFDRRPYPPIMTRKRNAQVMDWFRKMVPGFFEERDTDTTDGS